jgi:dihydrofolate synthase/folylpolyglutamate synthase
MNDLERYRAAIAYLDGLANLSPVYDYMRDRKTPWVYLKRTRDFLERCGNPQNGFKYVHVTGTSGKGTVATMVHESLNAAGKKVGSFTSPFSTAATEKIRVNGSYIAPGEFADILDTLKPHIERAYLESPLGRPAYFEIFLAVALIYFRRQQCEWVILEVGIGGRYDATNVIESPKVAAVTSIDYDHVRTLGRTLLSIADNKAGIIKKDCDFYTTEKRAAILKVFERECKRVGARFNALTPVEDYQENNITLARAIGRSIGLADEAVKEGIEATRLPCRFEIVQEHPLVILDGAHNRAKMRATMQNVQRTSHEGLHLILGLKEDKDVSVVLKEIVPLASHVYVTRFQNVGFQCADPRALLSDARKHAKKGTILSLHLDPYDALDAALKMAKKGDLVLVTGSFYLAGDLRKRWYPEEWVLRSRKSFG